MPGSRLQPPTKTRLPFASYVHTISTYCRYVMDIILDQT